MAGTVVQLYLKPVLESYFHVETQVRLGAAEVAVIVLRQGLVHVAMVSMYCAVILLCFRHYYCCLLYTSPSPRDGLLSRMPSSA